MFAFVVVVVVSKRDQYGSDVQNLEINSKVYYFMAYFFIHFFIVSNLYISCVRYC